MSGEADFPGLSEDLMGEILKRAFKGESADAIVSDVLPRTEATEETLRDFVASVRGVGASAAAGVSKGVEKSTRKAVARGVGRALERARAMERARGGEPAPPRRDVRRVWGTILLLLGGLFVLTMASTLDGPHKGASIGMLGLGVSCVLYGLRLRMWQRSP